MAEKDGDKKEGGRPEGEKGERKKNNSKRDRNPGPSNSACAVINCSNHPATGTPKGYVL